MSLTREEFVRLVLTGQTGKKNENTDLRAALSVMLLTPKIRKFLDKNDPKAVEQAVKALGGDPAGKEVNEG